MSRLRVGINGFGRIGRILFRAGFDKIEIVGINDLGSPETLSHLLKYDSAHGTYDHDVSFEDNNIIVNGKSIGFSSERDPSNIPWKKWEVDVVLECTGVFKKKEDFMKHIEGGAKLVYVSAPAPEADCTFVYGINDSEFDFSKHKVISNASCTTNCLAPLAKTLNEAFGIKHGVMTTIHSYTNDQRILDAPHKDLRRARAGAISMIPTTTGAAKAVGLVLPELKGKIDGMAIRVPTPNVSCVDFTVHTEKKVTVDEVNKALINTSEGPLKGVLACEEKPLVSVDYMGNPASSTVDLMSTIVVEDHMVKVLSWYDNEMGFSSRMVDFITDLQKKGL